MIRAIALAALVPTAALAIDVTETVAVPGPPEEVWAAMGDFCAIAEWHEAVASCVTEERDGATIRTLELEGGGTLVEERLSEGETAYGYAILDGPLPVADYTSELSAEADGDGTLLTWTGTFDAANATDEEAEAVIRGIYRSGLDSIAAR